MTRKKITLGQHWITGRRLQAARNAALSAGITLHNAGNIVGYREIGVEVLRLVDKLDALRSQAEDAYCREWPDDMCTHIYYPGSEETQDDHRRLGCQVCDVAREEARRST